MNERRMYCGASGDDLGLISPATRFNPVPRYQHVVLFVSRTIGVLGCMATLGLLLALYVFGL